MDSDRCGTGVLIGAEHQPLAEPKINEQKVWEGILLEMKKKLLVLLKRETRIQLELHWEPGRKTASMAVAHGQTQPPPHHLRWSSKQQTSIE